ncbi:MAG: RsmE family RNA methyltransferase [Acidimicrobiia bacterium]
MPRGFAADADAKAHTFVDRLDPTLTITGDDGHHLTRVRRLRAGDALTAADGSGVWRRYVVRDALDGSLTATAEPGDEPVEEPLASPPLAVAFALTKGQKPAGVVRALTELGVDRVLPVSSARSVVRRDARRSAEATSRLRVVAREAACQCRRARLPEIVGEAPLDRLQPASGTVVLAAQRDARSAPVPPAGRPGWLLVVGPEGGLEPSELAALGPDGVVGVGPHVLRAPTAAVAATAVLVRERWRRRS